MKEIYYVSIGGTTIEKSKASSSTKTTVTFALGKTIEKVNPYYGYFDTWSEAKSFLDEYWNDKINEALDLVDAAKENFRKVQDLEEPKN